jgi:hypothetical protein
MTKYFFSFLFILFSSEIQAQVGIFQWEDHLNYNNVFDIVKHDNKVIAASPEALFYYNTTSGKTKKISTLQGLSESGITAISYNEDQKAVVIGYETGNIDLLIDNEIITISDLKETGNISGSKRINQIINRGYYSYLACDFGILKINVKKQEVADTYIIGDLATNKLVEMVAIHNDSIFAANSSELYIADLNNPLLAHYSNWKKYNLDTNFVNDTVVINHMVANDVNLIINTKNKNVFNHNIQYLWKDGKMKQMKEPGYEISGISGYQNDHFLISGLFFTFDLSNNLEDSTLVFNGDYNVVQAIKDSEGNFWGAGVGKGILEKKQWHAETHIPNGPKSSTVASASYKDNKLWVSHGGRTSVYSSKYSNLEVSVLEDGKWSFLDNKENDFRDYMRIIPDPTRDNIQWAALFGGGVVKYNNMVFDEHFTSDNSSLVNHSILDNTLQISDLGFDEENTLWILNNGSAYQLSSLDKEDNWKKHKISSISPTTYINKMTVLKNNQKWLILKDNSIVVFDENQQGTTSKKITTTQGNGHLINGEVNCVTEDLNGNVWVGTNGGLSLFQSPEDIFGGGNFDATDILVFFDGNWEKLLKGQIIYDIAVDGGNRKWIATGQGVYLTSPDGKEQLKHFHTGNSPLFSNKIIEIAIHDKTGDVFFVTDKGMIAYREGVQNIEEEKREVFVFPNPIYPEYSGEVTIQGLVANSDIRITDISGRLVFEGTSLGNSFIWDGNTHEGKKAAAGVYMVFSSEPSEGKWTERTKFTIIR